MNRVPPRGLNSNVFELAISRLRFIITLTEPIISLPCAKFMLWANFRVYDKLEEPHEHFRVSSTQAVDGLRGIDFAEFGGINPRVRAIDN